MNPYATKIVELLEDNSGTPLDVASIAAALWGGTARAKHALAALEARGQVRRVGRSGRWTRASRQATS